VDADPTKKITSALMAVGAGAMLTMIAETMLPKAFERCGGTIVGSYTLVDFPAALTIKLIHRWSYKI
jgi:hypothetical protein